MIGIDVVAPVSANEEYGIQGHTRYLRGSDGPVALPRQKT